MIHISDKALCVGCNGCVQRCPTSCISMNEDEQGFLYPKVDTSKCINCGLCEKVCPVLNQGEPREPLNVYAAINKNEEIVKNSSSGGVFYALAESVIKEGGVVFGARFDEEWQVMHDWAETIEGLKAFQGSKYVQSRIGTSYQQAEKFLKAGRKVMFTGTPCQIRGLVLFLRKDYGEQLLKVEVICHGVPSPAVWREYLKYITRPKGASAGKNTVSVSSKGMIPSIDGISFRDKRLGWEKYGFRLSTVALKGDKNSVSASKYLELFHIHNDDPYFWAFNTDLILRPACFACPSKCGKAKADITIGDFWHIKEYIPTFYKDNGVSLMLVNSTQGQRLLNELYIELYLSDYEIALKCVPSIERIARIPKYYVSFWNNFYKSGIDTLHRFYKKYRFNRLQKYVKNPIKFLIGEKNIAIIRKVLK